MDTQIGSLGRVVNDGRTAGTIGSGVLRMDAYSSSHPISVLHHQDTISARTWVWCFLGFVLGDDDPMRERTTSNLNKSSHRIPHTDDHKLSQHHQ